jgi:hypothetical protein
MNQAVLHNTIDKPYKVYRALLKLSTSVSATVLENTLDEAVTWSYNAVVSPNNGRYIGTCPLFNVATTHVLFNKGYDSDYTTSSDAFVTDTPNKVEIVNYNRSDAGVITHIPINNEDFWSYIEIKVYS